MMSGSDIVDKYILKARKILRAAITRIIFRICLKLADTPERSQNFHPLFDGHPDRPDEDLLHSADRIVSGEYAFLGVKVHNEKRPDWHKDYLSGYTFRPEIYYQVRRHTPENVDIKNVWELSCFFHLLPVAMAYKSSSEDRYKDFITMTIRGWINSNPCPIGVNWCNPMVAALRLMNLIEVLNLIKWFDADLESQGMVNKLVWEHLQFILFNYENLTIQPGNHYVANLVGVLWGSLYFSSRHPMIRWIRKNTLKRLSREIACQVHEDGMHFEGSTNYHRLVSELFACAALICQKNDLQLSGEFHGRLFRMFEALDKLVLPNGKLPVIGDNDDCRVFFSSDYFTWDPRNPGYLLDIGSKVFRDGKWRRRPEQDPIAHWMGSAENALFSYPRTMNRVEPSRRNGLRSIQIYVYKNKTDYLAVNCGNPGRRYSGHSHNDTLGFICCFDGTEVFVDPGTFVYTRDPVMRNLFRSTAYHNVVQLDGLEQCTMDEKKTFVLEKRYAPNILKIRENNGYFLLEAESRGFREIGSIVKHNRKFKFQDSGGLLTIADTVALYDEKAAKAAIHNIATYLHLSREVQAAFENHGSIQILRKNDMQPVCRLTWDDRAPVSVTIEDYWLSEKYGQKEICKKIVFRVDSELPYRFNFSLQKL